MPRRPLYGRSAAAPPAVLLRPIAPRGLGEMRGLLHSRALLPLIPPPPFTHKGRRGRLGVLKSRMRKGMQGLPKNLPLQGAPPRPCAPPPPVRAQRCCASAQRPSALKNNWRRRGCRRQYTRGFGGRPPWVAAQSGVALSDTANAALRQPPLPNPTGPSTSISIALPCRSAALRNDNSELSNITHCVKKYSPSALVITHRVMRPSQAVARPCLHRNGAMVCSKGAQ